MVTLQTGRMVLYALSRDQLSLALDDPAGLSRDLNVSVDPGIFSDDSRGAMLIKISRMDYADVDLHDWFTYFLLVRTEDRRALGVCGFKGPPSLFGSVELGYAIHPDFRRQGLMTEAVRALVDWAFTHADCRRVTAETLHDNFASQKVLQKSGMTLDRAAERMIYWKIDRETWEEKKKAVDQKA